MGTDLGPAGPPAGRDAFAPAVRFLTAAWPVLWIIALVLGHWQLGLVLLLLTGPVLAATRGPRRRARLRERERRRREVAEHRQRVLAPGTTTRAAPPAVVTPENVLAAAVAGAQRSRRLDADALELVGDLERLLRPLLARVREPGTDAAVRRDVEAIATDHLPGVIDAYLAAGGDDPHRPAAAGTTPAGELRSQLVLLVQACRQLNAAVADADASRQQALGRYLDATFGRSDLDL